MLTKKYFIRPPLVTLDDGKPHYHGYRTYSEYNYLRPGFASLVKTNHFETVLRLAKNYFHRCNVIDFGCADGPFLPSLANLFPHVVGVDKDPLWIDIASRMIGDLGIDNVDLICNKDLGIDSLKTRLSARKYQMLFLLQIIEHVGQKDDMYGSKILFISELFDLLDENGIMFISVPKMVGPSLLVQRSIMRWLGVQWEEIGFSELMKASFFNNTDSLEGKWDGGHLGFNHNKLETRLRTVFDVVKKRSILFRVVYAIKQRPRARD